MAFLKWKEVLAEPEGIRQEVELTGEYCVQIGVDQRSGTDWPVLLRLYRTTDGTFGIDTLYFGSHTDGDGEDYANFEEAYENFVAYYDA